MTTRLLTLALCLAALCLSVTQLAQAQIYRWVDENGKVHFTDQKPESDNAKKLNIESPKVGEPDVGELRRRELLRRAEEDFQRNRKRAVASEQPTEEALPNKDAKKSANACQKARIHHGVLDEQMPVYWTSSGELRPDWARDTYRGERTYVADIERGKLRAKLQQDIVRFCQDPEDIEALTDAYDNWIDREWCSVLRVKIGAAKKSRSRTPKSEVQALENDYAERCR